MCTVKAYYKGRSSGQREPRTERAANDREGAKIVAQKPSNVAEMTEEQRNARTNVAIPMPMFLRLQFEQEAKAADKQLGPYVRDLLAEKLGIVLPEIATKRKSKYATEEDRKAAQKSAALKRKEEVKQALAEFRARRAEAQAANAPATNGTADNDSVPAESEVEAVTA